MAVTPATHEPTLRVRLVTTTVAATMVVMSVLAVGVQVLLTKTSESDSVDLLRARADAVAATVRLTGRRPRILETPADSLDQDIWVFDTRGGLVDGPARSSLRPAVNRLSHSRTERTVVLSERTRLLARPVLGKDGRDVIAVVVAGLDLTPYETSERRGLWLTIGLGLLAAVAAGSSALVAARYSLGQVRRMARRADDWQEHDLSGRFDLGPPVDEITELGRTLDGMLDRIATALQSERRLTDEVAHELRTPLSVIRSEAQLAMRIDPTAESEPLRNIVDATERMDGAIRTMLAVARAAHHDEQRCDAAEVLDAVVDRTQAPAQMTVLVERPGRPLWVGAPQAVVSGALSPVVENAVRHGRREVRLTARQRGRRIVITVRDDGPGVDADDLEAIFRPGRGGAHHDGAGLGLALARRLASSAGGQVTAVAAEHGLFELDLPAG